MLWFQTRHSKSSFLFPFPSRVWVLSRHTVGSAWFLFPFKAPPVKYSHLFSIVYSSPLLPVFVPRLPTTPVVQNINSVTGALRQSSHPWVPPALWDEGGKAKKNTVDCLCFIRALQHWFNISEKRHQWHFSWLSRDLWELACGFLLLCHCI